MKKIFFIVFATLFFFFLLPQVNSSFAIDCNDRPASCPLSTYPECVLTGPRATACPPSNSAGINPCPFTGRTQSYGSVTSNTYCAYVIDTSVRFSCNATHQCVIDPNGTLDSTCNGGCSTSPPPDGSIPGVNYGGAFGGPATSFSCGSGANAVWTLNCIFPLFASIISWALTLAGTIGVIFIILGGIKYTLSGGDPKKIDQARKIILFAVVGLVIIFLSFFILSFIGKTTGVACLDPTKTLSFQSCP